MVQVWEGRRRERDGRVRDRTRKWGGSGTLWWLVDGVGESSRGVYGFMESGLLFQWKK